MTKRNSEVVPVRRDKLPDTLLTGSDKNVTVEPTANRVWSFYFNQFCEDDTPLTPGQYDDAWDEGVGEGRPAGPLIADGERDEPILDTLLLKTTMEGRKSGRLLPTFIRRRSSYKLFSRAMVGMMVPGDFYFITFTSSPKSPHIEKSWLNLRRWFKRNYPLMTWLYCITNEGYGVIHIIARQPKGSAVIDVNFLRQYWQQTHLANIINIKKVFNPVGLANYMSDQRNRKGMAVEMSSQETIKRWRMSAGWVPKAFMKAFGRFWYNTSSMPEIPRQIAINQFLLDVLEDYDNIVNVPFVDDNGVLNYGS